MTKTDDQDQRTAARVCPRAARRAGRPSASEAGTLGKDVLAAALMEFRSKGFAGASIERIAITANVTRSAIYRRHVDKQTLFETVLQAEITKLRAMAEQVIQSSTDPLVRLHDTAEAYCRFILSPVALDLQRIVISEAARAGGSSRIPAVPADLTGPLDAVIATAQAAGRIKPGPTAIWRDALLRLVAEGPRWEALASGAIWSAEQRTADFERMWPVFLAAAAETSDDRRY